MIFVYNKSETNQKSSKFWGDGIPIRRKDREDSSDRMHKQIFGGTINAEFEKTIPKNKKITLAGCGCFVFAIACRFSFMVQQKHQYASATGYGGAGVF